MMTTQFQTEIEIVFKDYDDEETPEPTSIDATVVREGNEVTVETGDEDFNASLPGFDEDDDGSVTFRVCEIRDEVQVAPVDDKFGLRDTQTANLHRDDDALEPKHFKYGEHYADKLVSSDLVDQLGQMFDDTVEEFVSERGIKPVAECDFEVPDIELTVVEGTAPFPSSKTGQTTRSVEKLLVEPAEDVSGWDAWEGAICDTGSRYTVWAGTQHKGTAVLLAPEGYEPGDTLSLAEYLDAWYHLDPADVVEASDEIAEEIEEEQAAEEVVAEFPQLRGTDFEPEEVWNGVEEAADTGEPVTVATAIADCDGSVRECSLDRISYRVTPDGDIDYQRIHTY